MTAHQHCLAGRNKGRIHTDDDSALVWALEDRATAWAASDPGSVPVQLWFIVEPQPPTQGSSTVLGATVLVPCCSFQCVSVILEDSENPKDAVHPSVSTDPPIPYFPTLPPTLAD